MSSPPKPATPPKEAKAAPPMKNPPPPKEGSIPKPQSQPKDMRSAPQKPAAIPKQPKQEKQAGGFPEGGKKIVNLPQGEKQKDSNYPSGGENKNEKSHDSSFPLGKNGEGESETQAKGLDHQQKQGYQASNSISAFQSKEESLSQSHSENHQPEKSTSDKWDEPNKAREEMSDEDQSEQGDVCDRELSEEEISEEEFEESQSQSYESQSKEEKYESQTQTTTTSTTTTYITVFKQSSTYVQRLFHSDGSKKHQKEIDKFREECKIDDDDLGPDPARSWFEKSPELQLDEVEGESDVGEVSEPEEGEDEDEEGSEEEEMNDENQSLAGDVEYDPQDEEDYLIEGDLAPCPAKLWFEKLSGEQNGVASEEEANEAELSEIDDEEGSQAGGLQSGEEEDETNDEIQYDEVDEKECMIKDDLAPCPAEYWFKRLRGMSLESDEEEEEMDGSEPEDLEEEDDNNEGSFQDNVQYDEKEHKACMVKDDLAPCPAEIWFKRLRRMSEEQDQENSGDEYEVDVSEPEEMDGDQEEEYGDEGDNDEDESVQGDVQYNTARLRFEKLKKMKGNQVDENESGEEVRICRIFQARASAKDFYRSSKGRLCLKGKRKKRKK